MLGCALALFVAAVVAAFVFGPLLKNRGPRRSFYGEDKRHALKAGDAYNGVRLVWGLRRCWLGEEFASKSDGLSSSFLSSRILRPQFQESASVITDARNLASLITRM